MYQYENFLTLFLEKLSWLPESTVPHKSKFWSHHYWLCKVIKVMIIYHAL